MKFITFVLSICMVDLTSFCSFSMFSITCSPTLNCGRYRPFQHIDAVVLPWGVDTVPVQINMSIVFHSAFFNTLVEYQQGYE